MNQRIGNLIILAALLVIMILAHVILCWWFQRAIKRHLSMRIADFTHEYTQLLDSIDRKLPLRISPLVRYFKDQSSKQCVEYEINLNECIRYCEGAQDDVNHLSGFSILLAIGTGAFAITNGVVPTQLKPVLDAVAVGVFITMLIVLVALVISSIRFNVAEKHINTLKCCLDVLKNCNILDEKDDGRTDPDAVNVNIIMQ